MTTPTARNFIDGQWVDPGNTIDDTDPGNGEVIGRLARSGAAEVDAAVQAARRAASGWADLAASARARVLREAADHLEASTDDWGRLMTREMGKPLTEARVESARAAAILRFFAGEAHRPFGQQYASDQAQTWLFTRRSPVGVIGIITPWNFPAAIPTWKLAPALIFGNTAVLKLADDAALTGLRLIEALDKAGIPPGVINVVIGRGTEVGAAMVEHDGVDAISFTGSTETGRGILEKASRSAKRVQLEMGGHNPVIVRSDAALDSAVAAVALGAFASAGQKCTATRRVYVARDLYDSFTEKLVVKASGMNVGYGLDESTEMGPLVNEVQLTGVLEALERAEKQGKLHCGGKRLTEGEYAKGCYMGPAVFTDLPHDSEFACEEIFGPNVAVWPVDDDEEAIERANATSYDLSAAIFTRDLDSAKKFIEQVKAGIVHVNSQTAGAEVHVPFGGLSGSGYGPHEQGRAAIEFYTQTKTIYLDPA
ncbi:MAG: aldehyde dehydrogenase family protein [Actinobacteria bacterium]|nr:aldehyde dehydrogenase family protein [Actinomycetota bacterium]